jgi:metal-responsive CopG/Arc/MetJ family transcriptional regulator
MKRMTIEIDEGLARQLAFIEQHEGISPSSFICEALRTHLPKLLKEIRLMDETLDKEKERQKSQQQEKISD